MTMAHPSKKPAKMIEVDDMEELSLSDAANDSGSDTWSLVSVPGRTTKPLDKKKTKDDQPKSEEQGSGVFYGHFMRREKGEWVVKEKNALLAVCEEGLKFEDTEHKGQKLRIAQVFGGDGVNSCIYEILPGMTDQKKWFHWCKSERDLIGVVLEGSLKVQIAGNSDFQIGKNGVFRIPSDNEYLMRNHEREPAKVLIIYD